MSNTSAEINGNRVGVKPAPKSERRRSRLMTKLNFFEESPTWTDFKCHALDQGARRAKDGRPPSRREHTRNEQNINMLTEDNQELAWQLESGLSVLWPRPVIEILDIGGSYGCLLLHQGGTKVGRNKNLFILPDARGHNILRSRHGTKKQPQKTERRMVSAEA